MGLDQLPLACAGLVLHGDLTSRYAAGSHSRLARDKRTAVLGSDRQGESEHGHRDRSAPTGGAGARPVGAGRRAGVRAGYPTGWAGLPTSPRRIGALTLCRYVATSRYEAQKPTS